MRRLDESSEMKMASEDVIELGSSDDETEPAPKRKKPAPNAMVQFPNKLLGVKVKAPKTSLSPLQKVLGGGAVTITKAGKPSPLVNKPNQNIRPLPKNPQKVLTRIHKIPALPTTIKPIKIQKMMSINPLNVMKIHQTSKLSLPPGITVKSAVGQKISSDVRVTTKKVFIKAKKPEGMITTVLDDDDDDDEVVPVTSGASPQWYLRPEEQTNQCATKEEELSKDYALESSMENSMEVENNKEPDKTKYIEITIEDSPIKPVRVTDIGTELAITIDDSPVKALQTEPCASGSDSEMPTTTIPQSKKKLEYHKHEKDSVPNETETQTFVEIDLEKCEETEQYESYQQRVEKGIENKPTAEESTIKRIQPVLINEEVERTNKLMDDLKGENNEFHPVYQKFIDLCFKLENSDDMKKIVEKKIKTYYRQCPKEYVESEEFIDMVSSKIFAMKAGPDKMYLYIKDVVDELNLQRKTAKAIEQASNKENKKSENNNYFCNNETERDSKKARQIRKLEKTIKKIHRAIQKLEEQEVEFEDEEDSVYLLTERYKERLIRVYAKFCQLSNTKMPSEPRIQIDARPGQPTGPAKRLEKWVNRKVPIGTPLPFPDFHDVLQCVRDANKEDRLGWNEADIMEEARDLFTRCGKKLQRRRQENEWRIAASRITYDTSTADPAEKSEVLRKKLEENRTLASKKETELFNKYADKQNQLKLVGEEIGDKEAEESPAESEDEEVNDCDNSLENKHKRKERLKRLLHEKTRKMSVEKENSSIKELRDKEEKIDDTSKTEEKKEANETLDLEENKVQAKEKEKELNADPGFEENIPDNNNLKAKRKIDYDDTFDVDSDIDELHLLQKLYSENEMNSSYESGSDSPIAISDSLDSESESEKTKKHQNYDVISIENSSYSESEMCKEECPKEIVSKSEKDKKIDEGNNTISLEQGDEIMECDENILLASSEEENDKTENQSQSVTSESKNTFEVKKLNNYVTDEVILDDCDGNLKKNDKIKQAGNSKSSDLATDDIAADESNTAALIEQNNIDMKSNISAVVIENNEVIIDSIDSTGKENEEHDMITDECSTQNSEESCEIVSISEAGIKENVVEIEINSQTNLNNFEPHNDIPSSEVASKTNEDNIKANVSLQLAGIFAESHKSPSNSIEIVQTENKSNECETSEDMKMDISEHLKSTESLKNLQTNASENVQTSGLFS